MYYLYWVHAHHHTDPTTQGYIGISNQPNKRFKAHTTDTALVGSRKIREYVEENGLDSVTHTILHTFNDLDSARQCEKSYRPVAHIGWNIKSGGGVSPDCTNRTHNQETKKKISEQNKLTKSTRCYESNFKGMTNRWSDAQKQLIGSYHKGKTISKEHKQAIRDKLSGGKSPKAKSVQLYDTATGNIYEFDALTTASKALGINYSTLRSAVQRKQMVYKRWEVI